MNDQQMKEKVIQANIAVHSKLATEYNNTEPHFRPENTENVKKKLSKLVSQTHGKRLLDLGCGTGFIINVAKTMLAEIEGVDITPAMLGQVDTSGSSKITLHESDTGTFEPKQESFDIVTSYSFLHHLYDIGPTLKTAFRALRKGGVYYVDLEPNFYFWEKIKELNLNDTFSPSIQREIQSVSFRDEEIEKQFGVSKDLFNHAEYSKNIVGGFREDIIVEQLKKAGFSKINYFYNWFCGQGLLINDSRLSEKERLNLASSVDAVLQDSLPLSKVLFKYIGFFAEK